MNFIRIMAAEGGTGILPEKDITKIFSLRKSVVFEDIKGVKACAMTYHEEVSIEFKKSETIGFTDSG